MSDKPIVQRLFIKPGDRFLLLNPPPGYQEILGALPMGTLLLGTSNQWVNVIQIFVANRAELEARLPQLKQLLAPRGIIWVTYHKGTSKVKTDINRDTINAYALSIGLTGVAMISIDEDWSALRLKIS